MIATISNLNMDEVDIHREQRTRFMYDRTKAARADSDPQDHKRWSAGRVFYSTMTLMVIGILLLTIQIVLRTIDTSHPPSLSIDLSSVTIEEIAPCGTNSNEARELGCNFDPLTFAWLPPRCYNYNLTAEFLQKQDWTWYRRREDGTLRQLSLINVMQGNDEILHVTWEYHRQHCVYLWLKMHQAMMRGDPIDGVTMLNIITDVCDGVLRSPRELNDTSVPGYVRFPSCKKY